MSRKRKYKKLGKTELTPEIDTQVEQHIETAEKELQEIRVNFRWGKEQLKTEMEEKSWLTVSATQKLAFNTLPSEVWKNSLKHLGGEYEMLVNFPLDPQLN